MYPNQKKNEGREKYDIKEEEKGKYTVSEIKSEDGKVKNHKKEKDKSPKQNTGDVSSIFSVCHWLPFFFDVSALQVLVFVLVVHHCTNSQA